MADVKQKMGQWWLDTVLHTPDVIIESVEFVSIFLIQDGLQPGLKCVAIEISGANNKFRLLDVLEEVIH